ncbi:hypothetical protein PCANC_24824 [Puccinia coronata f. sp. avenae]|uniref:Uncharacterized protein n=1 Tax=Puccinia coronata f. sp. avenae TaxID=200324 RepID=A0A2N5TJK6_9BASI|nr:hypothetical protein PCANC_24824 [Puccinia coronata f. sp. avenae]
MRRFIARYLYMAFILIQRGSLGVELTPTSFRKGPDIDLNVKALPEEEPSIATAKDLGFDLNLAPAEEQLSFAPSDSATSLTASTVLASVEKQDLTGHKTKPLAATSTDWNYVKVDEGPAILTLNGDKQSNSAVVFWIQRENEIDFFQGYNRVKLGSLAYPRELPNSQRTSAAISIILEIYDTKISHLNQQNLEFLKTIQTLFDIKASRINRIARLIKTSTVLSVIYLSLYKEHPATLEQHLRDFTGCIERLLRGLRTMELKKGSIAKRWHYVVTAHRYQSNAEVDLSTSWRTIEYWLEKKKHAAPQFYDKRCHSTLTEIVGRIIFFSNCQ